MAVLFSGNVPRHEFVLSFRGISYKILQNFNQLHHYLLRKIHGENACDLPMVVVAMSMDNFSQSFLFSSPKFTFVTECFGCIVVGNKSESWVPCISILLGLLVHSEMVGRVPIGIREEHFVCLARGEMWMTSQVKLQTTFSK